MMEVGRICETSVYFYLTTQHNGPEGSHFHIRRRENLKFHWPSGLREGSVVGSYELSNELSGSITGGEFLTS
jgi:hypothetical protein